MSQIIKNGSIYSVTDVESIERKLPIGVYNLIYIPLMGFRFEKIDNFELPDKIYGDLSIIERSISVYRHRKRNFGLLLSGLRGSGKSLLMKKLATDLNQPVIIINESFEEHSGDLIKLLTDPSLGDCTILFDEFEKKFDKDDLTPLTLLDGVYNTHHFYILTVNTTYINENLINRPGRIYYHKSYTGLDDDTIREVGNDLLNNKEWIEELINCCEDIRNLSFDMLISIINDINLFNENPKECIKMFGFDRSEGSYIKIYQIFSDQLIDVTPDPVWIKPEERYVWVDDIHFLLNDGTEYTTDIRLDLLGMEKVSKFKYHLQYQLLPARLNSSERDKFVPQTLEFEIHTNQNIVKQLIF